jgi:ATP-dependent helicase HrpB
LARIPKYDPHRGLNTLLVEKISRASADQRAGRAGRTAPGVCLRLWSAEEHGHRPAQETPEVKRLDLAEVALTLKACGVRDLRKFRWLEPPEEQALARAEALLADLGAVTTANFKFEISNLKSTEGEITALGRKMVAFPVHPRYARMLLAAQEHGCVHAACWIAALTQGRDLFERNAEPGMARRREEALGEQTASDFWLLRRAWEYAARNNFRPESCRALGIHAATARQVGPLAERFLEIARLQGLDTAPQESPEDALRKCILIGFSDRVARQLEIGTGRCELAHGRRGTLARESVVRDSPLLVAAEVQEVEGREKSVGTRLSLATAIDENWLRELFPGDISASQNVFFDPATKRVYAEEQSRFRGLTIGERRVDPPADAAARLLAEQVLAGRLKLDQWDDEVEQWILRLNLLAQWCPELALPPIGDAARQDLVEQICHGAVGYKDIKDKPVKPAVKGWLNAAQQELLERHAPERLTLANGRAFKVAYQAGGPPHVAVRIQQLYDVKTTPRIALGRVAVLVHILAPNHRPVQITQDLAGFWRDQYPRVKQELRRKYPRHEWR